MVATALLVSWLAPLGTTSWAGPSAPAVSTRGAESLSLEASGDASLAEGKTEEAVRQYAAALSQLPPGVDSISAERGVLVVKYTSASCDLAEELAERGEYTKAKAALTAVLAPNVAPHDKRATELLAELNDADQHNPALSPEQVARVEKARKLFIIAQGQVDIGAFDAAEKAYNQILALDPTNTGARRGLERVSRLINNHLRASRDDTRARMINDVDRQWETQVHLRSPLAKVQGTESLGGATDDGRSVRDKLQSLVLPRLALSEAPIDEVLNYLTRKAIEADVAETDPAKKGVNIIFNTGGKAVADFKTVTLDVRNSTLGEALRSVGDQTGTRYSTEGNTVTVSPLGQGSRILTRQFRVPPGFLAAASSTTAINGGGAAETDPFSGGADKIDKVGGLKVRKLSAKEFLEQSGVPFPEGTSASYLAGNHLLLVRNTEDNLGMVATLVEGLSSGEQRQVLVRVILLKSEQRNLEELGYDWLMGAANLGSNGVFVSGGTAGNAIGNPAQAGNFGIADPLGTPIGGNPITAGLRGAFELQTNPTIDDLLVNGTAGASLAGARSPGLASFANVFGDPQFQMIIRGLNQKKGIDLSIANTLILKAGQRAAASSLRTIMVPTEFDPPQIPQTFGNTDGGGAGSFPVTPTTPQSFEPKETGSSLEVEATVSDDGHTVDLNLNAIFREFDGFINFGTPITTGQTVLTENAIFQPVLSDTNISVSPQVYDGATITVGGLSAGKYEMIDDKVPLFGDIPFFGRFFKSTVRQTTKKAVIYFVTVKVVDPAGVGRSEAAALAETVETQAP